MVCSSVNVAASVIKPLEALEDEGLREEVLVERAASASWSMSYMEEMERPSI